MSSLLIQPQAAYAGLVEKAAPGTHAACLNLIQRWMPQQRGPYLDVAAGNGAFIKRLKDLGFHDLEAIELDVAGFSHPEITPYAIDLNTAFAAHLPRRYGLVTAIEIIEHLDDPRAFLRQIRALLADDGLLLVTTPNIQHWLSRVKFLLRGELNYFSPADYHDQRHITAITDFQMKAILQEVGFELCEQSAAGSFWGPLKRAVYAPFERLLRLLGGYNASGDVNIYLAKKAAPRRFRGSDSFYFRD